MDKPTVFDPVSLTRAPLAPDNPAIMRYSTACFFCGNCKWTCLDHAGVLNRYTAETAESGELCIYCGQCVNECPGIAMSEREHWSALREIIRRGGFVTAASVSPAVRVSLAEAFGAPAEFSLGKVVSLLKKLGFTYVLDTTFGADLTVMEEANELVERIRSGKGLPMFTSCCPAWVRYAELFYPEFLPNLSETKSPICMQGTMIKTAFAARRGLDPKKIITAAITPCTAKKYEISRPEMNAAGEGIADTDYAITVRELVRWAKAENIRFEELEDLQPDCFSGSGAGTIFGSTGGVTEAAVRTAYYMLNGTNPPEGFFRLESVRGSEAVREAEVDFGTIKLKAAVIYGTKAAGEYLEAMKTSAAPAQFVEVMSCPGGCVGGGGQPKGFVIPGLAVPEERRALLYGRDASMSLRLSHENPEIRELYSFLLNEPGSDIAKLLLHVPFRGTADQEATNDL